MIESVAVSQKEYYANHVGKLLGINFCADPNSNAISADAHTQNTASTIRHLINDAASKHGFGNDLCYIGTPMRQCAWIHSCDRAVSPNRFVFISIDKLQAQGEEKALQLIDSVKAEILQLLPNMQQSAALVSK